MEYFVLLLVGVSIVIVAAGVKIVPQSQKYVIERFGRFQSLLGPGIQFIWPFIDQVAHKVDVLERRLPENRSDVITKDNVVVRVQTSTFYRVIDPERTVYRIADVDGALQTAITGVVRSIIGLSEFDEVQSNRSALNGKLIDEISDIAEGWGIEVTRCEIIDVDVDAATRTAMQLQINAERERRAQVTRAEGEKRAVELNADAELYAAQKAAEARRITADADAYATTALAEAINRGGDGAIRFEVLKRQVEAMREVASANNSKIILLPADLAESFSSAAKLMGTVAAGGLFPASRTSTRKDICNGDTGDKSSNKPSDKPSDTAK